MTVKGTLAEMVTAGAADPLMRSDGVGVAVGVPVVGAVAAAVLVGALVSVDVLATVAVAVNVGTRVAVGVTGVGVGVAGVTVGVMVAVAVAGSVGDGIVVAGQRTLTSRRCVPELAAHSSRNVQDVLAVIDAVAV